MSRDLNYETTRSFVRGVFSNPLTSRNAALLEECPRVKRGGAHRCSAMECPASSRPGRAPSTQRRHMSPVATAGAPPKGREAGQEPADCGTRKLPGGQPRFPHKKEARREDARHGRFDPSLALAGVSGRERPEG